MNHAKLSCSNSNRWSKCAGSIREEARYVDVPSNATIDGTGSHVLLGLCLNNNYNANDYDQQIIGINHPDCPKGWLVKSDRTKRVQMCLDYVDRRLKELAEQFPGSKITVKSERKSDPGKMFRRDDWWGTMDIIIICLDINNNFIHFIEVIDYKDGREFITVNNNTQLISYLTGEMQLFKLEKLEKIDGCRMTIVQPKTNPVVRYNNVTPRQLLKHAYKLSLAAKATDDPNAPLNPGKHCKWCKANPKRGGHCTAQLKQSLITMENMTMENMITIDGNNSPLFEYISKIVADPKSLNNNQLTELADAEDSLFAAFKKIKDEIELRIEQGQQIPGYAILPGNSSRIWNEDEEIIVKKLKSRRLKQGDIFLSKLISVAALMKCDKLTDEQKKKIEKELVTVKTGKLILKKVNRETPSQPFTNIASPSSLSNDDQLQVSFL